MYLEQLRGNVALQVIVVEDADYEYQARDKCWSDTASVWEHVQKGVAISRYLSEAEIILNHNTGDKCWIEFSWSIIYLVQLENSIVFQLS